MPLTPANKHRLDTESSLLEMTAEEKVSSDSDGADSSVHTLANDRDISDEEECSQQNLIKLSEDHDSNCSQASEHNNNSSNIIDNNIYNEIISHRFSREIDGQESDSETSDHSIPRRKSNAEDKEKEVTNNMVNIIECTGLMKL